MSDREKSDMEKRNEESLSHQCFGISNHWEYTGGSLSNSSMGQVPNVNTMTVCGNAFGLASSLSSMMNSFGPTVWEHPISTALPLGFNELNDHIGASTSNPLTMPKGSQFSPNMSGMLPPSLSHFPDDSGFIERAASFYSFSRGHFANILNPLGVHQPTNPYLQGGAMMQGPRDVLPRNAMKAVPCRQLQKTEANVAENSKDIPLPPEAGALEGTSSKNETAVDRFQDEAQGVSISGNDSEDAEFGGRGGEEAGGPSSVKGLGSKKRKRINHDVEPEQDNGGLQQSGDIAKNNSEIQQKGEPNTTPTDNKSYGQHGASDPPKGEYIHVRARRGQATNSHSLAERVRREKISERMKFLQDLVPGCSKVIGKAVMLDEIINYVQSLQRQVEFLSMKLATVNPRLDLNIEQLFAKNHMFAGQVGPSGPGFSLDMPMAYPPLRRTQPPILQPDLPDVGNSSDALRRTISPQSANMMSDEWEDELHNVVHMGLNACIPFENQEKNCLS